MVVSVEQSTRVQTDGCTVRDTLTMLSSGLITIEGEKWYWMLM